MTDCFNLLFNEVYVCSELYFFLGETPLLHAARQGHTSTAKYLLEQGADPAIASEMGTTALHHSAGLGWFPSIFSSQK